MKPLALFILLITIARQAEAVDGWGIYNDTTTNVAITSISYTYTVLANGAWVFGPTNIVVSNVNLSPGGRNAFTVGAYPVNPAYEWVFYNNTVAFANGSTTNLQTFTIPYGYGIEWFDVSQILPPTPRPPASSSDQSTWPTNGFPIILDTSDLPPPQKKDDCGMPVWDVSEPCISLWLRDEPLGYAPAAGARISFELTYDQRDSDYAGDSFWPGSRFSSVGKHWKCSWLSHASQTTGTYNPTIYFSGGGQQWFSTWIETNDLLVPVTNNTQCLGNQSNTKMICWPDFPANILTNSLILSYPDGSQYWYLSVNYGNNAGANTNAIWQGGFLSQMVNQQGQKTLFNYAYSGSDPYNPVVLLQSVVDGDGRTNLIYYDLTNNFITRVVDPFGRTTYLKYNQQGDLTNITDVAGNSSSLFYDTNHWVTNLTTPYGTTTFAFNNGTNGIFPDGRSILVTPPDNSHELYLYSDRATGVPSSFSSTPNLAPFTDAIDNVGMGQCNSFHWGPRQYAALSTTNPAAFTTADYRKAHLKHWLLDDGGYAPNGITTYQYISASVIALEREPSPDNAGNLAGQITWYAYPHQYGPYFETENMTVGPENLYPGDTNLTASFTDFPDLQYQPTVAAKVLPDGTTAFARVSRNLWGNVTTNVSTYAGGLRTNVFNYAANGLDLLTVANAAGVRVASNYFNAFHQVLTNYDALNQPTIFCYNTNHQTTSLTLPNGLVTTNIYNADNSLAQQIIIGYSTNSFTYTNDLIYIHSDARGLVTTNTWDNLNRLTSTGFPDGSGVSNVYTKLDLTATKDRLGNWTYLGYDALRRNTTITNALRNVTWFNYCTCGALESSLDAATNLTQFFYDNQGNLTNTVYADNYATFKNYNVLGQVVTASDSAGGCVTNVYNNQGLLTSVKNATGTVASYGYDILDRVTNSLNADGVNISMTYDNLARPLTRRYPDAGVDAWGYTLNVTGPTSHTNQLKKVTLIAYDGLGRKTNEVAVGVTTNGMTFSGAGDLLTLTDGRNQTTQWYYDVYGRLANQVDAANRVTFVYQYDADNHLTNRWTPAKGTTTYAYDAVGNQTNISYGGANSVAFAYDAVSRMTSMVDGLGINYFTYTAGGELSSAGGLWDGDTIRYTYNNRLRHNLTVGNWNQTYSYDNVLRLTNITSGAGRFGYTYDAVRRQQVARVQLPNMAYITNSYDAVARVNGTSLVNLWNHVLDGYTYGYDLLGQRTNIARNYGLTTSTAKAGYDAIGELTSWTATEANGAARLNEQFGYVYDAAGNLQQRTNNALVQTFGVDAANALTNVTRSGPLTVSGNTPAPVSSVTVNGQPAVQYADFTFASSNGVALANGLNGFTNVAQNVYGVRATNTLALNLPASVNLGYDLNGNLTNDGTKSFSYDVENQLTNVMVAGQWREDFLYDGLNRRRITRQYAWQGGAWSLTNETRFIYDGNAVLQEWNSSNAAQVSYTRGINGLLARTDGSGSIYYHADGNRNITALMDGNEIIVGRYLYDPFGRPLGQWGTKAEANVYRFASKEWDVQARISYFGRRFYDSGLERFLNRDPIGERGGQNLYAYCQNNPVCLIDMMGFCPKWWDDLKHSIGNLIGGAIDASDEQTFQAELWQSDPVLFQQMYGPVIPQSNLPILGSMIDMSLAAYNGDGNLTQIYGNQLWNESALMLTTAGMGRLLGPTTGSGFVNIETTATQLEFDFANQLSGRSPIQWPANGGFAGDSATATLVPGTTVDRFGIASGSYVSPTGTPFIQRSLAPGTQYAPYNVYTVLKPIQVDAGEIAPAFGMPGGGMQYNLPSSVQSLIDSGHLGVGH
jgi:RHS repeat-associated protein